MAGSGFLHGFGLQPILGGFFNPADGAGGGGDPGDNNDVLQYEGENLQFGGDNLIYPS